MADVATDVLEVIAKQAKVEPAKVARETELADLNLESLDTIELIFALEEKFNIEIPYNANDAATAGINFTSAGDVIDAVSKLVNEQKGSAA
jgi:acyl carrier protein